MRSFGWRYGTTAQAEYAGDYRRVYANKDLLKSVQGRRVAQNTRCCPLDQSGNVFGQ